MSNIVYSAGNPLADHVIEKFLYDVGIQEYLKEDQCGIGVTPHINIKNGWNNGK